MNATEKNLFFRRLSLYLKTGVPIVQSLSLIIEDSKSKKSKVIFSEIKRVVSNGQPVSSGLLCFPKEFDRFSIGFISAGEISGNLSTSLETLSIVLYKRHQLQKRILSAISYPALVLCASLCVSVFLVVYIFPKILPILEGLKTSLPLSTKILIFFSDFLRTYWWLVLVTVGALAVISIFGIRIVKVRQGIEKNLLRTPFVGTLFQYYAIIIFSRTLSLQLNSGVQILQALQLTQIALPGTLYSEQILTLQSKIADGQKLSATLRALPQFFPILVCQLVAVGETTGTLSLNLESLADLYEEYLDDLSKTITLLIEPTLMVCMGFLVGFIAMAIISPVYEMTQNLSIQ
jgi:type II secretory pathway component PulF